MQLLTKFISVFFIIRIKLSTATEAANADCKSYIAAVLCNIACGILIQIIAERICIFGLFPPSSFVIRETVTILTM